MIKKTKPYIIGYCRETQVTDGVITELFNNADFSGMPIGGYLTTPNGNRINKWGVVEETKEERRKAYKEGYEQGKFDARINIPPNEQEVCEALGEFLNKKVYYEKSPYRVFSTGLPVTSDNYIIEEQDDNTIAFNSNICELYPPRLITLIGRFYEGKSSVELELETVKQELAELKELIKNSKKEMMTSSVDTGHHIYTNTKYYYIVSADNFEELCKGSEE